MAYDSARGVTVLFGGSGANGETWEWDGSAWSKRSEDGPLPRQGHRMAYDESRGVTILFGGRDYLGYYDGDHSDTWEWDGSNWTQRFADGPAQRSAPAMTYDAERGVSVLFGGQIFADYTEQFQQDTWEWNGANWTQRADDGPPARRSHAMVYDSARGVSVLFGGDTGGDTMGDTWAWDGSSWAQLADDGPNARSRHAMAFDSGRSVTVLFGGVSDGDQEHGDTWEWDGSSWTQVASDGPAGRYGLAMAYDSQRGVTVLFGGIIYHFGRVTYFTDTWEWDGSNWSRRATEGPSGRHGPAMVYDAARGVTVLFGGWNDYIFFDDTWEWDGTSWTKAASGGPRARSEQALAYDSGRGVAVMFGGWGDGLPGYLGDTWEWTAGAPVVSRQPESVSATVGQNLSFHVTVSGAQTYQWRRDGADLADGESERGSAIRGATTAKLTIENVQLADGGDYDVVVANDCGSVGSDSATLTVEPPITRGDLNCDGGVDFNDIDPFVTALISRDDYDSRYPDCNYLNADVNADGGVDFNDIDGFVDCIINNRCP
jgi:hypothetical protein